MTDLSIRETTDASRFIGALELSDISTGYHDGALEAAINASAGPTGFKCPYTQFGAGCINDGALEVSAEAGPGRVTAPPACRFIDDAALEAVAVSMAGPSLEGKCGPVSIPGRRCASDDALEVSVTAMGPTVQVGYCPRHIDDGALEASAGNAEAAQPTARKCNSTMYPYCF
jgi:hypothetical protein